MTALTVHLARPPTPRSANMVVVKLEPKAEMGGLVELPKVDEWIPTSLVNDSFMNSNGGL